MKIIRVDTPFTLENAIAQAVTVLRADGMVVYPTETCYGLGVDATNKKAVQKLLDYKGGRANKAISVAVADINMAEKYVVINEMAEHLYTQFLPGPVTVVSKSKGKVAPALVSDTNTLGIRIPDHPVALALVKALGKPFTATSANTSGQKPPYSLRDLKNYTSRAKFGMIDLFMDAGTLPYRPPSTVVDTTLNELMVIRQGEVHFDRKKSERVVTTSEIETQEFAERLTARFSKRVNRKPLVLALQGELGAGKTQFAKGVAKALGITENVPSPTYTIVREYRWKKGMLYHLDTWRLHEGEELEVLGVDGMLKPGNVIVIEWLQKAKPIIQTWEDRAQIVWVDIEQSGETERTIRWWSQS